MKKVFVESTLVRLIMSVISLLMTLSLLFMITEDGISGNVRALVTLFVGITYAISMIGIWMRFVGPWIGVSLNLAFVTATVLTKVLAYERLVSQDSAKVSLLVLVIYLVAVAMLSALLCCLRITVSKYSIQNATNYESFEKLMSTAKEEAKRVIVFAFICIFAFTDLVLSLSSTMPGLCDRVYPISILGVILLGVTCTMEYVFRSIQREYAESATATCFANIKNLVESESGEVDK